MPAAVLHRACSGREIHFSQQRFRFDPFNAAKPEVAYRGTGYHGPIVSIRAERLLRAGRAPYQEMADGEQVGEARSHGMRISVVTVDTLMAIPAYGILNLMLTSAKHS